jgi:hypothetical protein
VKRHLVIAVVLVALVGAGFATSLALADVSVSGDNNGTVTIGQSLVIAVSDSLDGTSPGHPPYYCVDPNAVAAASGRFTVGPLGGGEGGTGWIPLSVSCTNSATWNYSGNVTVTVPADVGASEWISVAVHESLPYNDYNFNQTYTVAAPATTTTSASTSSTGSTTTVTQPPPTTSLSTTSPTTTAPTTTQTVSQTTTVATTTVTTSTTVTAPPPVMLVINMPSTITIQQTGSFIYITITTNDQRSPQTLCWRRVATRAQTCRASHGIWHVKLRRAPGKRVFVLKEDGKVVAQKTVSIRLKA